MPLEKFFEKIPGLTAWVLLFLLLALAFFKPSIAAFIIIYYIIYCTIRAVWSIASILYTYRKIHHTSQQNWFASCQRIKGWDTIHHVVLIPTYQETLDILEKTFLHLASVNYPTQHISVVLATEEVDTQVDLFVHKLQQQFGKSFSHFFITRHTLIPGEVSGKGSNQAYAIKSVQQEFLRKGFSPRNILITSLDADYRVHPEYFGYLTAQYLTRPSDWYNIFQPIPMFFNDIWHVPFFSRLVAMFFLQMFMAQFTLPDDLVNFSCYSLSLELLMKADYWDPAVIQEDSRLYWRTFFAVSGKLHVVPLYIPMYGNAVCDTSLLTTMASQYRQIKRWAWGMTDLSYVIKENFLHSEISLFLRIKSTVWLFFYHLNWATVPLVLFLGTSFITVINPTFSKTVLSYNLAYFSGKIFSFSLLFIIIIILIAEFLLYPPKPSHWSFVRKKLLFLQWLFLPVLGVIFSSLPALDSQTRSLFGKQLKYEVSAKKRRW